MIEMSETQEDIIEVAKKVLGTLLDLLGISASIVQSAEFPIEVGMENAQSIALNIEGEDLGILIGRRGQTLASLQYIVRLIVGNQTRVRPPLTVDVEGYKQRQCEALRTLAWRIAEQVKVSGESLALEPMTAFDRRIIHLVLADDTEVVTESIGEGEARRVVILPKGQEG